MAVLQMCHGYCGAISPGAGNVKFMIVAIDYFTKWVEAKALRTITGVIVRNFVWEYIVCRFGIPRELKSTGETPFSLVYGSEAMIHAEVFVPMYRIANFDESANKDDICENLNFIEERRLMATIREAKNKQQIAKYYNKKVRVLAFDVGE
ncbi:uncharacterized protein [Rutidosis leptorrhynchoides]|uniref:uncharacterized protein n=1 Tax=Rutidosis leptorrhynchoides TaxID=125765 RepID=UPI003A995483